jgi:hypothetical protein
MSRSTVVEPAESGPELSLIGRAGWGAAAAAAAALGCAAGLAAGGLLPWKEPAWAPVLDGGMREVTLMTALGGAIGWTAGAFVWLALGPRRFLSLLARGVAGAVAGALAGGLGPIIGGLTNGRLPAEAGAVLACAVSGALAGFVGVLRSRRSVAVEPSEDEWPTEQRRRPVRHPPAGPVVRLGPILAVTVGSLAVVIVGPPSPSGWPMLCVGLLGLAVAWALSSLEHQVRAQRRRLGTLKRRVRTLRRQLRERTAEPAGSNP